MGFRWGLGGGVGGGGWGVGGEVQGHPPCSAAGLCSAPATTSMAVGDGELVLKKHGGFLKCGCPRIIHFDSNRPSLN